MCYGIRMVTKRAATQGADAVRAIADAEGVKRSSLAKAAHVSASPIMRMIRRKGELTVGEAAALAASLGKTPAQLIAEQARRAS